MSTSLSGASRASSTSQSRGLSRFPRTPFLTFLKPTTIYCASVTSHRGLGPSRMLAAPSRVPSRTGPGPSSLPFRATVVSPTLPARPPTRPVSTSPGWALLASPPTASLMRSRRTSKTSFTTTTTRPQCLSKTRILTATTHISARPSSGRSSTTKSPITPRARPTPITRGTSIST